MSGFILVAVPIFAAFVTATCAFYVGLRLSDAPGAREYAVMLAAETWWALGYVAELLAPDLESKIFWDNVQLPPAFVLPAALLLFAFEYTGRRPRRWRELLVVAMTPPVLACAWVFSDALHGRARSNSAHLIEQTPFDALTYRFSAIELASYFEMVLLVAVAVGLLLDHARKQQAPYRVHSWIVGIGAVFALVAELPGLGLGIEVQVLGQRDSSPVWFSLSGVLITWGLGRRGLFELVPIARDAVFEQMDDPVFVLDSQRRLVDANPAARALLGTARRIGVDASEALAHWPALLRALDGSGGSRREVKAPEGSRVFDVEVAELHLGRGAVGAALVLRDVTDRRDAREELERRVRERTAELSAQVAVTREAHSAAEASERKFRAILDGAYELIGMLTLDGVITDANRAALDLVGVHERDVLGKRLWETPWWAHSAEERERIRNAVERARGGEFMRFETTHPGADGVLHHVDFSLTPVRSGAGQVVSLVAEGRDITERKRAEDQRARLEAQLQRSQKLESIGRLAGGVAHDFNNLITVILGNAQLARRVAATPAEREEFLDVIEQAAQSAASLTHKLLAFARQTIVEPTVLDLNEVVTESRKLLDRLLGEDVELATELAEDLWPARLDRGHMEQIIVNLAVNARDAMPSGGRLAISTANVCAMRPTSVEPGAPRPEEFVALTVRDEGTGMPPEVLARVFEPFFTTKPAGMGTGLGLSMVYGAVEQAGGFVDVKSEVGRGTTFVIHLPRDEERHARAPVRAVAIDAAPTGTERIALVEDQLLLRATLKRELESLGYRVEAFASAESAIAALGDRLEEIDLLLTDVVLAGLDGRRLVEELRARRPGLRYLLMSGYTEDVVVRHGVERGSVKLLEKPFSIGSLARSIREALVSVPRGVRSDPPE